MVILLPHSEGKIVFPTPLIEAKIINRPNRFIANCEINGKAHRVHCPTTGSIGGMTLDGLSCLLSGPHSGARATEYTLEAIAIEEKTSPNFQWIGINQTQVNRYVEAAIVHGFLTAIPELAKVISLKREPRLGSSRLDFLINESAYVEVKMPLKILQVNIPPTILQKKLPPVSADRMVRQVEDITEALGAGKKALMILAFCYDNEGFHVPDSTSPISTKIQSTMSAARSEGMDSWQVNFKITPTHLEVTKILQLNLR